MGYSCAACTKTIRTTQHIKCSRCSSHFHQICVNLKKLSEEIKLNWTCPLCKAAEPRRDNTNTPVRLAVVGSDEPAPAPTVNQREVSRKITASAPVSPLLPVADSDSLSTMITEMRFLRQDVGEIKSQMKSLTEHITKCNTRLDECENSLALALERLHAVEERSSIVMTLENTITQLRDKESSRAQSYLKNEIEIAGVNENANENPMNIIRVIGQKIGLPLDDRDLDYIARVGPQQRRDVDGVSTDLSRKLPRPLVVRFLRRHQRDEFLKVGKSKRNLNCSDIEVTGAHRNIYFNERLTQEKRHLFRAARHRCNGSGFKYCWIKNGSVYVRRQEGNPAINIKNMDELLQHVYSSPPEHIPQDTV